MENYSAIKRIWMLAVREWRILTHRRLYPFVMVGAPVLCVIFFLTLMQVGLPQGLPAAVVDKDNSNVSRQLIRTLDNFKQSSVVVKCQSFQEARQLMQEGKVYGIYYVPENFERDVLSFRQPTLSFYTNTAYIVAGSLEFQDLKTISVLGGAAVGKQMRLAKGQTEEQAMKELQPINIETHPLGNPWVNYSIYLSNVILPGLLCAIIIITTVFALGSEVKNRRSGELMYISGDNMLVLMLGKLLPHALIYMLMATFIDVCLYSYMGFPCHNGLGAMLIVSYLFVLACISFAVALYALIPKMRVSLSLSAFYTMLSFSISGFTFPVEEMHHILQVWSKCFPLRHYFLLYVNNALNGRAFCYAWGSYAALVIFMLLPLLTAKRLRTVYKYDVYEP